MTAFTGSPVWVDTIIGPSAGVVTLVSVIDMGTLEANRSMWLKTQVNETRQLAYARTARSAYSGSPPTLPLDSFAEGSWKLIPGVEVDSAGETAGERDIILTRTRVHPRHVRTAGGWLAVRIEVTHDGTTYTSNPVWMGAASGAYTFGIAPIEITHAIELGSVAADDVSVKVSARAFTALAGGDAAEVYGPWECTLEIHRYVEA